MKCLKCKRSWPWNNRHNLTRQPCRPSSANTRDPTPDQWLSMRLLKSDRLTFLQRLGLPCKMLQSDDVCVVRHGSAVFQMFPLLLRRLQLLLRILLMQPNPMMCFAPLGGFLMTWVERQLTGVVRHLPIFPRQDKILGPCRLRGA